MAWLAAGVASGCGAAELTVVNFGGANGIAQRKAYVEPFRQVSGAKVTVVEYNGEMAKLKSMVESRKVSWDVVELESGDLGRACDEGLLEKIDHRKFGPAADFTPSAKEDCGFGAFIWATVLAYNGDRLQGKPPANWADFWDVRKYPGKRGLRKSARSTLEFALMADGVPPAEVYTVLATPAGVERAFRKLDALKGHIQWWETGAQPAQFLVAGDVVMSTGFNGRIDAAQREGKNLRIVWNQNLYDLDYWAVPKGSPNRALAEQFIAFVSTAESQLRYVSQIAYGPVNLNTARNLDKAMLANMPTSLAHGNRALLQDLRFWIDHGEELERRFSAWSSR
jgi:putative spermidine/putrescine transport system substrate-binding protein